MRRLLVSPKFIMASFILLVLMIILSGIHIFVDAGMRRERRNEFVAEIYQLTASLSLSLDSITLDGYSEIDSSLPIRRIIDTLIFILERPPQYAFSHNILHLRFNVTQSIKPFANIYLQNIQRHIEYIFENYYRKEDYTRYRLQLFLKDFQVILYKFSISLLNEGESLCGNDGVLNLSINPAVSRPQLSLDALGGRALTTSYFIDRLNEFIFDLSVLAQPLMR